MEDDTNAQIEITDGTTPGGYVTQSGPNKLTIGHESDFTKGITIDRLTGAIGIGTTNSVENFAVRGRIQIIEIGNEMNSPTIETGLLDPRTRDGIVANRGSLYIKKMVELVVHCLLSLAVPLQHGKRLGENLRPASN